MKGEKLINIYVIKSVEYLYNELSIFQKLYVKLNLNKKIYDRFRINILLNEGDDLEGIIKIHFPSLKMECFDEYGVLLN
jgi:hypothetical protein